jgi:hypothetical protein
MPTSLPSVSPTSFAALDPAFAVKVQATMATLAAQGWQPRIVSGWRSMDEQAAKVAAGFSTVKFSFHNAVNAQGAPAALAVDIVDKRYGYGTTASTKAGATSFWPALGAAAKAQGLYWGGDWQKFKDVSHIQMYANSALSEVRKQTEAFWSVLKGGGSLAIIPGMAVTGWFEVVRRLPWWYWAGLGTLGLLTIVILSRGRRPKSAQV